MGGSSSHTYLEAGKRHPDTKEYKDEDQLASIGKHPDTITQIRVWWQDFVVGMEVFYDGVSAGQRLGNHYSAGLVYQDIVLAPGEYIQRIHGRAGDLIDHLEFVTSTGRTQAFGTSTGGTPFDLQVPGQVVKGFTLGFGGHLHVIGAHFAPVYAPPVRSATAGKTHPDTAAFDDTQTVLAGQTFWRMSELRVIHDGNLVYGVTALYEVNGAIVDGGAHVGGEMKPGVMNQSVALPAGTFITKLSGRHGDVMDSLDVTLNNGMSYHFGGAGGDHAWVLENAGKELKAIAGGHGGHIHNVAGYF